MNYGLGNYDFVVCWRHLEAKYHDKIAREIQFQSRLHPNFHRYYHQYHYWCTIFLRFYTLSHAVVSVLTGAPRWLFWVTDGVKGDTACQKGKILEVPKWHESRKNMKTHGFLTIYSWSMDCKDYLWENILNTWKTRSYPALKRNRGWTVPVCSCGVLLRGGTAVVSR